MITLHREKKAPASDPIEWGDGMLLALIDTPELQRLRRIRQLGPAARVYPSAEHSRFSHAMGTMHLTKRILSALSTSKGAVMDRPSILAVKVAALFHDVGHGPYSHVFEHLLPGLESHELWGWHILSGSGTVRTIIESHCRRLDLESEAFYARLAAIWGVKPVQGTLRLGKQVISSQLDADRMDYLLRDAYFTGVSYGRYDLEWLLHSLRAEKVNEAFQLCVDMTKGPVALESYVTARDHMYRQVYDHKTVRAYEALLVHIFQLLIWIMAEDGVWPEGIAPPLARFLAATQNGERPALSDYLALDDTVLDYCFGQWAESKPVTPGQAELRWKCRMFRDRSPRYRRLRWRIPTLRGTEEQLAFGFEQEIHETGSTSRLTPGPVEERYYSDLIHDVAIAETIDQFFRERRDQRLTVTDPDGSQRQIPLRLLVHVDRLARSPYAHMQYTPGHSEPVYVVSSDGEVQAAEKVSPLIHFLGQSHRRQARVFVDPRAEVGVLALVRHHLQPWV